MYKIICLIIFHKLYLKHALTNPYLIQPIIHNKNNSRFVVIMLHISTPQLKQKKTNFDRIMKEEGKWEWEWKDEEETGRRYRNATQLLLVNN